jgi:hypothetical protein
MAGPREECVPTTICHNWSYQDPMTQKWVFLQLLCGIVNYYAGETLHDCTDADALKELAAPWLCQGSPAKLRAHQMEIVCEAFPLLDCSQPVCWSPLELEGAYTALICELAAIVEAGQQ